MPPSSGRPGRTESSLRARQTRPGLAKRRGGGWEPVLAPAVLVAVWLFAAALLAPERPQDQAAICQRHNGPDACRGW